MALMSRLAIFKTPSVDTSACVSEIHNVNFFGLTRHDANERAINVN